MHILLINDDGPPSNQSSPYVHAFFDNLQKAGHQVSVVLPHEQRSWIGKAHFVGQLTKPTYFRPGTVHKDDGTTHARPLPSNKDGEEWILVNGTPATCAQLGLHHFFQDRAPIDLVISGPNYGRNSTSLFSLSSGTIGGAMEAAVCQKKAVALSFAFWSRDHDPELIAGACRHSVKLIEYLYNHWGSDVDLYSCNVPVVAGIEQHKTVITHALQNYWTSGSSFEEVDASQDDEDPETREKEIRESDQATKSNERPTGHKHRHFKWAPKFGEIQKSIDASPAGNDGWALHQGYTSVTPLKANYMHASDIPLGELKLTRSLSPSSRPVIHVIKDADSYVLPLINSALSNQLPKESYRIIISPTQLPTPDDRLLQITPYELLDFTHHLSHPTTSLANSYIIRKALIRKHYLHNTVTSWWSKHADDQNLKGHVPLTVAFEVDYAEFLDEALVECWELHESFAQEEKEWWVLKPGMSDQGQGIKLFSTEEELRAIFEAWEQETCSSDQEGDTETPPAIDGHDAIGAGTMTSQLRHFVAQRYIQKPLLLPAHGDRKFHIRSYVLAVGALRTYVYRGILALFAPLPYSAPVGVALNTSSTDLSYSIDDRVHLTNSCLQDDSREGSVVNFWDLHARSNFPVDWKESVFDQLCAATGTLFEAAAREQMIHFQTLENSFEIFGIDWMVDEEGISWLLEVNAFPDFKQSGDGLKEIIKGLWEGVFGIIVKGFFGPTGARTEESEEERFGMRRVLDIDLGRR